MPNFLGIYTMAPMTDFAQQTVGVNAIDDETITELMRIVCYDQPIYDDTLVEGDEWLGLTLDVDRAGVRTTVRPLYDQAAILIQDNDSRLHNIMQHLNIKCMHKIVLYFFGQYVCIYMIGEWSEPT